MILIIVIITKIQITDGVLVAMMELYRPAMIQQDIFFYLCCNYEPSASPSHHVSAL